MMDDLPKRHVRLGPGPEFDRIRRAIAGGRELPQAVRVGPGDDAAVIEGGWVISTDMSVEDVHFRRASGLPPRRCRIWLPWQRHRLGCSRRWRYPRTTP